MTVIGFSLFGNAQRAARDSRRKTDLRNIASALQLYYNDNRAYPAANWVYSNGTQPWITGLTSNYIALVPTDPVSNGGQPWISNQYGYAYWSAVCSSYPAGSYFVLVTQLENKSDADRIGAKPAKWCDGQDLISTYGWSPYSYVISSIN